jgi:hypothetical protein
MNKKSILLLLIVLVAFASSCKKDKENPQSGKEKEYLISRIVYQQSAKLHIAEEYRYDDKDRLINLRIQMYETNISLNNWKTFNYTYDATNKLTKAVEIGYDNKASSVLFFTYNYNTTYEDNVLSYKTEGDVTAVVYPISLDNKDRIKFAGKIYGLKYDSNGHLIYYGSPTAMENTVMPFVYDNKNNPFANVVGLNPHFNFLIEPMPPQTVNNIISVNSSPAVFDYNADNFPVASTITYPNGEKAVTTYEYIVKQH